MRAFSPSLPSQGGAGTVPASMGLGFLSGPPGQPQGGTGHLTTTGGQPGGLVRRSGWGQRFIPAVAALCWLN